MTTIEAFIIICRFLFDGASLFIWGAGLFSGLFAPSPISTEVWTRLARLRWLATGSLIVALISALPLRVASVGNGWADAINAEMVRAVMLHTNIGTAWLIQLATTTILFIVQTRRPERANILATTFLAGILLISLSLTGHAVMSDGTTGFAHQVNNTIHVLAAGAWVGALPSIVLVLGKMVGTLRADALTALMRFSVAGHAFIVLVLVSGLVNSLLILGHLPMMRSSSYEIALALKICLVLAMIALALTNRYFFVPRMRKRPEMAQALILGTIAEILITPFVIGLVAWFGMIDPE